MPHLLYKNFFVTFYITIRIHVIIFEDEIVNEKAFEHVSLIFTEPWALTDEIMLNIMQNLNLIFSKASFRSTTCAF